MIHKDTTICPLVSSFGSHKTNKVCMAMAGSHLRLKDLRETLDSDTEMTEKEPARRYHHCKGDILSHATADYVIKMTDFNFLRWCSTQNLLGLKELPNIKSHLVGVALNLFLSAHGEKERQLRVTTNFSGIIKQQSETSADGKLKRSYL